MFDKIRGILKSKDKTGVRLWRLHDFLAENKSALEAYGQSAIVVRR
jgi:hypothetical protein